MHALRQWAATAYLSATSAIAESPLFILEFLMRALRVSVLLSLWRVVFQSSPAAPLGLNTVLTYSLLSEAFSAQLTARTTVAEAFWQGTLTQHCLRPMPLASQFIAETLGFWSVGLICFSLPLLLCAPWLGVDPWPASLLAGLGFVSSLLLAVSVGFAIDFVFAALTVALEQPIWPMDWVRRALTVVLSGNLVPLALYPAGLGGVLEYSPFAALASAPLTIYTGSATMWRLLGPFPLDGMGPWLTWSLVSVVPAGFIAWLPSRALLGLDTGHAAFVWTPLAACAFGILAFGVFKRGLDHYRATGSTRYVAHGHRR